jgi:hypothetical protein
LLEEIFLLPFSIVLPIAIHLTLERITLIKKMTYLHFFMKKELRNLGSVDSVLNSCRAGPCRVRARRAFVPYRVVSFIILFFFVSCHAVPKNDRRRHGTDKARRVWHAVP